MSAVTLCRLCGTLAPGMINVEEDAILYNHINEYVPSRMVQIDGLPNTVCQRCREHLTHHADFLEACAATARDFERRMSGEHAATAVAAARLSRSSQDRTGQGRPSSVSRSSRTYQQR